ncbi:TetR family transcriptional regulator (plasmid) [Priestia endophytica]|uniref:TetR/AcrR family transcriptional regulator n=1 Tax=Priestia endophytica TaxID=135735 RepID=UPI000DCA8FD6|nr:TetR/AcrR family transcriptional regulator [Priestia endophytica]RAS90859.1 TetR family transcriptional regulator [Priestia endophytica]
MKKDETRNKITRATIELLKVKGYKGTTTREIAEKAGVNELTIFRHFGNKEGIIQAIVQTRTFSLEIFNESIEWELEKDLTNFGSLLLKDFDNNQDIISIALKDPSIFSQAHEEIIKKINENKEILKEYFEEMIKRGYIKKLDYCTQSEIFLSMYWGYFMYKLNFGDKALHADYQDMIKNSIQTFIKGVSLE